MSGYFIGHNKIECYRKKWIYKSEELEKLFETWKKRRLTLFGNCEIINTLTLSKLLCSASILPLPEHFMKSLNKKIYGFLWNSRDRIKRNTIIWKIKDGVLGLIDIHAKFKAMKASWLPKILNDKGYIRHFVEEEQDNSSDIEQQPPFGDRNISNIQP